MHFYPHLLTDIRARIHQAQTRAAFTANAELIALYWDIGRLIHERQQQEGWGAGVISRLSRDILNELPEVKGFSERNIKFMVQFFKAYDDSRSIGKQPVSQLGNLKQIAVHPALNLSRQS